MGQVSTGLLFKHFSAEADIPLAELPAMYASAQNVLCAATHSSILIYATENAKQPCLPLSMQQLMLPTLHLLSL
jgi:hypothetical protein